jgi:hypothetical protein
MKKSVTIDGLLEIAAFAEGLKNKAVNLIERMKEDDKPKKSRGLTKEQIVEIRTMRNKVRINRALRYQASRKASDI